MPSRTRRLTLVWVAGATLVALLAPVGAQQAVADPPTQPECLPLAGGSTGLLVVGGELPSEDQVVGEPGGFGAPAPAGVAATLPDRVLFKTTRETWSNEYAFALRDRRVYVRQARRGVGLTGTVWHRLEVPTCLDGTVTALSADHRFLVAVGPGRQVYSHDMPGGDLAASRWTWRWGPYFWTGSGVRLFRDVTRWGASELNSVETFTDTSGRRHHPIGVGTVYLLRDDHPTRITYLDPWLPQDQSREVCGPRRGTVPLADLASSGSTVLAVGRRGGLFTRLYDFDVSGANTVFGHYAWRRDRPRSDTRWQLPPAGWQRQPAPPGRITDLVGIGKTGNDARDRVLRVEGVSRSGRQVVWAKDIDATRWHVVARGGVVRGRELPLPARTYAPLSRRYSGTLGGRPVVVRDFHHACSPAHAVVRFGSGVRLPLLLHAYDGLRQERRSPGLSDVPREYNGAIEVPRATWRRLASRPPRVRRWVAANLDGRFTTAPIAVTLTRMRFEVQCWQLTYRGRPARPDQPQLPPDAAIEVGRLTEMNDDGRPPNVCAP